MSSVTITLSAPKKVSSVTADITRIHRSKSGVATANNYEKSIISLRFNDDGVTKNEGFQCIPVEMCDIFSARPAFSTAATESARKDDEKK